MALQQRALVDDTWQRRFGLLSQQLKVDVINYIVCFDISHTMGEETVSACVVVSRDGGHDRQKSRRLKINDITPGDDYAALKQALKRFTKNLEGNKVQYWPDVYLIDGGKGQVNAACEAIKALNLPNAPIILGMVKGDHRRTENDRVVIPESFEMPLAKLSEAGILLQNIRDLAHNEAIRFHRQRRQKVMLAKDISQIPGVGKVLRQRLLEHFGGLGKLKEANIEALLQVSGVSEKLAKIIYEWLDQYR